MRDLPTVAQQGADNGILDILTIESLLFITVSVLRQPKWNNEKGNGLSPSPSPHLSELMWLKKGSRVTSAPQPSF